MGVGESGSGGGDGSSSNGGRYGVWKRSGRAFVGELGSGIAFIVMVDTCLTAPSGSVGF